MDLVAEMLTGRLTADHGDAFDVAALRPSMVRRLTRLSDGASGSFGHTADRLISRHVDYPRWLRRETKRRPFDLYHVVDHSYAHLVRALPARRTVVTCHDLDAFRSILDPAGEPRPLAYRLMTRRILDGLCRAAFVTCDTGAVRDELLAHRLMPPARVAVVLNGVHPSRSPDPDPHTDQAAVALLGPSSPADVELLHVGSTIPRKRVDVLLRVVAAVSREVPEARLVRVGGALTEEQAALAHELGIQSRVVSLPFLTQPILSAVYRRAAMVLLPSEREGFGLPIVEALASGTPVVATDIPVLRETGAAASSYCRLGDIEQWAGTVLGLLAERRTRPEAWCARRRAGIERAGLFSWETYADRMAEIYRRTLGDC
jgi:glycosyltransferase involved in cell wall biosynthesis